MLRLKFVSIYCEIALTCIPQCTFEHKSMLDQIIRAWCHQQQVITWTNVDSDLFSHMASVGHDELITCFLMKAAESFIVFYNSFFYALKYQSFYRPCGHRTSECCVHCVCHTSGWCGPYCHWWVSASHTPRTAQSPCDPETGKNQWISASCCTSSILATEIWQSCCKPQNNVVHINSSCAGFEKYRYIFPFHVFFFYLEMT